MFWRFKIYKNGQIFQHDCPQGVAMFDDAVSIIKNLYGQDITITSQEYLDPQPTNTGGGLFNWF